MEALSNVTPVNNCTAPAEPGEEWRDITDPRIKDLYQVSNLGRVRNKKTGYMLHIKPTTSGGYMQVGLLKAGQYGTSHQVNIEVQRLVAAEFLPPPSEEQTQVDHIDGDPANNKADNLRWVTRHENAHNPVTTQRREASIPVIVSYCSVPVLCEETGEVFPSMAAAAKAFGVSDEAVRQSCDRTIRDPAIKGHKCWACPWHFRRMEQEKARPSIDEQRKAAAIACHQPKARPVRCVETGIVFPSVLAAARACNLAHKTVKTSCDNSERGAFRQTQYSKKNSLHFEWYKPEDDKED